MKKYKRYLEENDTEDIPRSTKYFRDMFDCNRETSGTESNTTQTSVGDIYANGEHTLYYDEQSVTENFEHDNDASSLDDDNDELNFGYQNEIFIEPDMKNEEYLYPGAPLTFVQSEALILSYSVRHHLTELALTDLLLLINAHVPKIVHQSKYTFLKKLDIEKTHIQYYYCEKCKERIQFLNGVDVDYCTNENCESFNRAQELTHLQKQNCFFLYMPVGTQLVKLLDDQKLYESLTKDCINGVTSGTMYKKLAQKGIVKPLDITLQWNTDGASSSKSSKCSIWPIQVAVNELPYKLRKENIILASIWQGTKPNMDTFLRPFVDELQLLHKNGIVLSSGVNIHIHCLIASVDSVARPLLQNIKQYNGQYGCSYCLKPGERVERGNGTSRVYCGEVEELRTEEQHLGALREIVNTGVGSVQGIKGPSMVMLIPLFNIISSFTPDYMHNVLLGVVRWFLLEWLDGKNSNFPWYLGGNKSKVLSDRLQNIKPPIEITRLPRALSDIKLWKASEFRAFLIYYSLPCLNRLLPNRFLKHWWLLVFSITTLLQEKPITNNELELVNDALTTFVLQTSELYGREFMTYNLHTLLHLPQSVKNWGALWDSSTFMFENFNGVLLNLFSGTQHISSQIFKNYDRIRKMNSLVQTMPLQNWHPVAKVLLKNLSGRYLVHNPISLHDLVIFGSAHLRFLNVFEQIAIENLLKQDLDSLEVKCFNRFIVKGIQIHASIYKRLTKRDNSIVHLQDNTLFQVDQLIELCDDTFVNHKYVIIGKELAVSQNYICAHRQMRSSVFIFKITENEGSTLKAIQPDEIVTKCIKVQVDDEVFISKLANSLERD